MIAVFARPTISFGLHAESLRPGFIRRDVVLLPDHIRKTVMFIGTKTGRRGEFQPKATAFLVGIVELDMRLGYLVTADHVVANLLGEGHELWLRSNRKNGATSETLIPNDAWWFYPEDKPRTDVAVCQINFVEDDDVYSIGLTGPNAMAATDPIVRSLQVGVGEEVAIVGLFRSHFGQQRNVPIVRIGNIAAMREEPVWTKEYGHIDAYLIEARSIGGLSGSPVFINMPPTRVVNGRFISSRGPQQYLLGLMHGHFDIRDLNADTSAEDLSDVSGGINAGIGVVTPVDKILDIILDPERVEGRRLLILEERRRGDGAVPDV